MQALRNAALLARFVLAWFALSVAVAVASPVVNPQGVELICTGAGVVKLVAQGDDGSEPAGIHTLDCPLCATTGAPPSAAQGSAEVVKPIGHLLQSIPAARIAALTAAPLPARGPPASHSI